MKGGHAPKYAVNEYARRAMEGGGGEGNLLPYGGLEPYLSTTMSSILASTLRAFEPESGAYLSLRSFTLGGKAPLVRGLRVDRGEDNTVEAHFDLDFMQTDLTVILVLKVSVGGVRGAKDEARCEERSDEDCDGRKERSDEALRI